MINYKVLEEMPWETRNLGMPAYQITEQVLLESIKEQHLADDITALCEQYPRFFVFARINKEQIQQAQHLEATGFRFIEGTLQPYSRLGKNPEYQKFSTDPTSFLPAKLIKNNVEVCTLARIKKELAHALREIASGIFTDDRFHIDQSCPNELANQRFSFWIDDLIATENCTFEILKVGGVVVGFMARKANDLILAGLTRRFAGCGVYLWFSSCKAVESEGYNEVYTTISTNNIPVMNLYTKLGFRFRNPMYSFHYWNEKNP